MFRRIMLGLTFLAAFGAASLATPDTSDAARWGRGGRYYSGSYYGPRVYGGYVSPYRAYYPGGYVRRYYGPVYGPRYYRSYYYGPYYYGSPRVAFRIGW